MVRFIVGITGGSASGKTFFLKSLLKDRCDMSTHQHNTGQHYSAEKRQEIEAQKARWRAVNYGETDSNISKFQRQVDSFGRIKAW